jgi:type VI secretion system protein VasI
MNNYSQCALAVLVMSAGHAVATSGRDCTAVASAVERLACFDQAAGTPAMAQPPRLIEVARPSPAVFALLHTNERQRQAEQSGFLLSRQPESPNSDQQRVMISAPALGTGAERRYLAISCQSNISHLQLLLDPPVQRHSISVQLLLDQQPLQPARIWRVLEGGHVVDAGRGLPAVDLLKRMNHGSRLSLRSDEPRLDGLVFDADGLAPLIVEERQACHW